MPASNKAVALTRFTDGSVQSQYPGGDPPVLGFSLSRLPEADLVKRETGALSWTKNFGSSFYDILHPQDINYSGQIAHYDTSWVRHHRYVEGERAHDALGNTFRAENSGYSGSAEPTWPISTLGDTVVDNEITWRFVGPAGTFGGGGGTWQALKSNYAIGNRVAVIDDPPYGTFNPIDSFELIQTGTTGATEPAWDTSAIGAQTNDGTCVWEYRGKDITIGQTNSYYDIQFAAHYLRGWLLERKYFDPDLLRLLDERTRYARGLWRDAYYERNGWSAPGYFLFPKGMYYDHIENSDPDATTAAQVIALVDNGLWTQFLGSAYTNGRGASTTMTRDVAYAAGAHVYAEKVGRARMTYADSSYTDRGHSAPDDDAFLALLVRFMAHHLHDWATQYAYLTDYLNGQGDPVQQNGLAPFMIGLTISALEAWSKWEVENGTPERIAEYWPDTLEYHGSIANPYATWEEAVAAVMEALQTLQHPSGLSDMLVENGSGHIISKYATGVVWRPTITYPVGFKLSGTSLNGFFVCVTGGESGATEPAWNTAFENAQTNDGGCVWEYRPNDASATAQVNYTALTALFVNGWAVAGDYYVGLGNSAKAVEMYEWGDKQFKSHCHYVGTFLVFTGKEWYQQWYNSGEYLARRAAHETAEILVFIPNAGYSMAGQIQDGGNAVVSKAGGGFGTKPFDAKPVLWWDANEGPNPSSLGRTLSWSEGFDCLQDTGIKAPGSVRSYKFDHGYDGPGGASLPGVLLTNSPVEYYRFIKRYDNFDPWHQIAARTRYDNGSGSENLAVGQTIRGINSGTTAEIEGFADNGPTGAIWYKPGTGNMVRGSQEFENNEPITNDAGFTADHNESYQTYYTLNVKMHRTYRGVDSNHYFGGNFASGDNSTGAGQSEDDWDDRLNCTRLPNSTFWNGAMDRPELMEFRPREWCHDEFRMKCNTVIDDPSGVIDWRFDSRRAFDIAPYAIRQTPGATDVDKYPGEIYETEISNGARNGTVNHYDCLYVDDSWCRAFLSWEPTYQDEVTDVDRYIREICIPYSWSDTDVGAKLRAGSLIDLEGANYYVVDNDGNAHNTGQFARVVAEPGFEVSVDGDLITVTKTAKAFGDFGTKAQAAPKVFDQFDVYWNNGVAEAPYAAIADLDPIQFGSDYPFSNNKGAWVKDAAAAYPGRSAGYRSPIEALVDHYMDVWRAWPTPSGSEDLYLRWYYQCQEEAHNEDTLAASYSGGETQLSLTTGDNVFSDGSPLRHSIIIEMDDASWFRTSMVAPKVNDTTVNIADPLPSAAGSGNRVWFDKRDSTKFCRIWDSDTALGGVYRNSWTWQQYATNGVNPFADTFPTIKQWNLMEVLVHMPAAEADKAQASVKASLNGTVIHDFSGELQYYPDQFPSPGTIPRLIGNDTSFNDYWTVPNNYIQIAEIWADTTPQRIEVANHDSDPLQATVREPCLATAWSQDSITFRLNKGALADLSGSSVYWFNENDASEKMLTIFVRQL